MVPPDTIGQDHVRFEIPLRQQFVFLYANKSLVMRIEIAAIDVCGMVPIAFEAAKDGFIARSVGTLLCTRIKPQLEMNPFCRLAEINLSRVV